MTHMQADQKTKKKPNHKRNEPFTARDLWQLQLSIPYSQIAIHSGLDQQELSKLYYLFMSPRKLPFCINL